MPLEQYRRKRDLTRTPEPTGAVLPVLTAPVASVVLPVGAPTLLLGARGRFVVGRHRATRLHYDLRLEIGGVLVSWAIPKGPTLDPAVRRMAVRVEDHPVEYLDFEDVIPRGQYGAGDAIVWDWGTYEAESPTLEPGQAMSDGELKFRLHGQKLRGRFTIVRTGRAPADAKHERAGDELAVHASNSADIEAGIGDQWLLLHKHDPDAIADWDAEEHPHSVRTGRTNEEVAGGVPPRFETPAPAAQSPIDLSAAIPAPFPGFVAPMLATLAGDPFDDADWLFEVKWDGYRVQAAIGDGRVRWLTRNGNELADSWFGGASPGRDVVGRDRRAGQAGERAASRDWISAREAVVDGELVALDARGRPDFELLQECLRSTPLPGSSSPLVYEAFDLLYVDGLSLLAVPLEERKRLLRRLLRPHPRVGYARHVDGTGRAWFEAARQQELEGIVAKQRRSRYEPGRRAATWLKLKIRPEQAFVVAGYLPGVGNAHDLGSIILGYYDDTLLRYAGRVGSGLDARSRRELRARLDSMVRQEPVMSPSPERTGDLRAAVWVEPTLVVRVAFSNWTADGLIRQSSFKGVEPDRDPRTVTRERAAFASPSPEAVAVATSPPAPAPAPRVLAATAASGPAGPAAMAVAATLVPVGATTSPSTNVTPDELAALGVLGREGIWTVGGFELKLTNLDKVLFPAYADRPRDNPITKRELIRYLVQIAPTILPHLAERALNVQRFPDGIDGPSFWQKAIPSTAPPWLRRWRETGVEDHRAPNTHLVADRAATMAWLGNQAAFEIHPWTARTDAPDRPTFALIDIDPGDRTTWQETLVLARLFRTALAHLGIVGCPKTTGKRGIQVWIPILPRYSYRETSSWVEQLSRAVGATAPDLVSWSWAKDQRNGRARLDYTQNASIKTLVAPYAVRPAPGAPVSAPIAWDELDDPELRPDRWTIRDILERVEASGDLFAPALTSAQVLPPLG